jgi:hypothetical protein
MRLTQAAAATSAGVHLILVDALGGGGHGRGGLEQVRVVVGHGDVVMLPDFHRVQQGLDGQADLHEWGKKSKWVLTQDCQGSE